MKKHLFNLMGVSLILLLSAVSLASGGNLSLEEKEELRIIKQDYRAFLIAQHQAANALPTEAEEMHLVKQDYRRFLLSQRQIAPTEAEEMKLVKQEYRQFLLEQHRIQQVARGE